MPVVWLAGSLKARAKREAVARVEAGEAQLAIGTHALIQTRCALPAWACRWWTNSTASAWRSASPCAARPTAPPMTGGAAAAVPHQLMMSATPIPALAMTYYADLDVSVIDELPPGRSPVVTRLVNDARRDEVIARVHHAAAEGRQVYWVCP